MFEAHVLHLLRKYLGEYVHGLSTEALRISVWKGNVVLKDLKLKAEALNLLKLPVTVKAGFVGTITLKVPWKSLGKEPVIVLIDRVFVLANPAPDGRTLKEEEREKFFEAKLQQIEEAESATLEAKARSNSKQGNAPVGNSWLGSLIATIIGNLKISISNVHIRYEDSVSNPGHPFSSGITLAKLAAVTTDEQGNETFDTSGALDKLRKSLHLERLAVYHDSDNPPWKIKKRWEDLSPKEWIEIFGDGINDPSSDQGVVSIWAGNRKYLVSPINGVLKYHRIGKQEREEPEIPLEKASLVVSDVSLTITEPQYHDVIKLMEVISRYKTHVDVSHLRPIVSVSEDPHGWWLYAAQGSLQQKKMCYRFSWDRIRHLCQLRRRYIQLYAASLQQLSNIDISEMRGIEKDLDSKVILLWRLLAHAKVESVRSKAAAQQRSQMNRSWFSFRWGTTSADSSDASCPEGSQPMEERLTKEEWQAINKLLSYQPDEELAFHSGKDLQNVIRFLVNVSISQAAARIIDINQTEIVCGRFEELHVSTKFCGRSTHCDVSLRFYGLSAPEGSLAQSFSSEKKVNALAASFVHSPVGENVDWRLSATIAPCHATVLMGSCDRFLDFLKRSSAVSPTVALETATALQMKLEKVTRRAQEQFQMVLEEQSRFALDIDFDAPKVRVPLQTHSSTECDGHFLLDFGHFTVHTKDGQCDEQRHSLYSRFYISGRDIAAFFMDCGPDCGNCTLVTSTFGSQPSGSPISEDVDHFLPLVDRCGMAVIVDQIKIPHPSYPSTRVSIQVPNLGIHFSPARYCRILELLNIINSTVENSGQNTIENFQIGQAPWSPADLATEARILVWRGIGNSVAEWQPCFVVLSGLYLYVLESEASLSYQRCASMSGRQVYEVPPTNVGGSPFSIAVAFRGMDTQKALESSNTLIIEFQDEEGKATWLRGLTRATYRASAPPSINVLEETNDSVTELAEPQHTNFRRVDLVINGTLVETKLLIYGKAGDEVIEKVEEKLIIEIIAGGVKVHLIHGGGDLTVKTKLHSLKIKDELQGCSSMSPQYLACSVLKDDTIVASPSVDANEKELPMVFLEDDDIFKDALPDFTSIPDHVFSSGAKMDTLDINYPSDGGDSIEALMQDNTKVKGIIGEMFYEAEGNGTSDFVVVTFSKIDPGSPVYDGIDTQMSIRMSKLEFFCNRPTLIALIGFGLDLSSAGSAVSCSEENDSLSVEVSQHTEKAEESARSFVKGLLGYGKGRVVFYLSMDVDSVCVILNKEDGSQLAMFVQESFLLDLKVHPSSLSMEGTLGNFRLCDMSLGADHWWGWLCDIRNQGVESLIKFTFNSYSAEDDDYEGYDYSLCGRLSAVRIVFLYRFVQEITSYFMELATPHSEEAIKLVDKVGGFEWLIHKYEIDGASALKLDLSLDTPIIILPRDSKSKDFLQLDLGQLQVRNEFSWHGCPDNDASAVHLDVLHAEILGVNMAVGVNGLLGKPMIREGRGLHIYVCRSLRDVFRKVPTFSIEVKVGSLHGVISDKEYNVILDCAYTNIYEEPKLPPSFRSIVSDPNDTIRMLADKVNINSQIFLSRTVTIVAVEVNSALLELCNGVDEKSPLARIALEGLWVSYRMTSFSEKDIYITIPVFSIVDIRPDTRPEMRLMLGSSSNVSRQCRTENLAIPFSKSNSVRMNSEDASDMDFPNPTMLLMDYRLRSSSQSFVVRVQQPRVLVVLDFLLAVGEFFVPALGAITGREEMLDPKNDPITRKNSIMLSSPVYKQKEDVVHLSPNRQLIADARGVDEYIYDGNGGRICLSEENDLKETSSSRFQPIIVVGRGQKLRFMNVKIENAALLRKYAYLSNDSSYSVSMEDGVDLLFIDSFSSDSENKSMDHLLGLMESSSAPIAHGSSDISQMQSITFEAQVVSPEFTFYDSSKSSLDDSMHGEKLLRAKMDLNFMYAAKESDTWIRALVKDLTIEAGSGLIILDPVDISGGYTSVKEKTNISVLSTDVCIHLSLSVISLVLNLQNQAAAALQFGNADPLASCTNFDRLWVSPKGNGPGYNLTFWRPRAPSNYVIFGDCVTSRPIPPSQAVMAVGNTYGRVRKPLGFKFVGLFSDIYGIEEDGAQSDDSGDCSLWLPISPPGYTALGCIAHMGNEPPPTHIVYCIRSDLVTSTVYSECIFSIPSNPRFSSGFSIWRLDNIVGSFYAHPATVCPLDSGSDIAYVLLRNSNWFYSSSEKIASDGTRYQDYGGLHGNKESASSSGWDILRSISKASCYTSTPHFERIWWDKGGDLRQEFSIWRPMPRPGYAILGDCITEGLEPPALGIIFKDDNPEISAKPVQFTKVAHIMKKGLDEAFFWYPIAPPGYASLGCVVSRTDEPPDISSFCCPRIDLVNQTNILEVPISKSSSSKGSHCWSIWKVENQACTFLARSDLKKPSSRLAYKIGDSVKPKIRENISAEMKLRCFSLTVLDNLCGMMTPLFDTTITNINLATHGRLEAVNAVLVSSIAVSTFNTQLEAWEPLVEPFDGIFKFETYKNNLDISSGVGKRVRVAATSIVNVNISAVTIETLAETIVSWGRQADFEQKSVKLNEDADDHRRLRENSAFSALDEDDFKTLVVENRLGCDIYLKKVEQNSETLELLHHEDCTSAWMPPSRFSDRLNVAAESREARCYVAVQIYEAKGLPIVDDGNSHNFFCALRLVVDSLETDQQKVFPQSARTKCVKPLISKSNLDVGTAMWNELFLFEVPRKGLAKLEVEVTNLSAKAGKGEVVGASSIPVGHGINTLKKVASVRMLHQSSDGQKLVSYPLTGKGQLSTDEGISVFGSLFVSTCFFETKTVAILHREMESVNEIDKDSGFWVGLGPEGPWESLRSLLPLSVIPKMLKEDFVALQVVMKNGKKHAIFRSLATVTNDSDVKMDLSVCPISTLHNPALSFSESTVIEEVFENQRYHSISGWGNRWPGFHGNDPGRWSTRDLSYSSKDFFETPLPPGWKWTSTWTIDKSHFVDHDGWAYGPDYQSIKWPPTSPKSCTKYAQDFVRRRRWIRTRKHVIDENVESLKKTVAVISPGSSTVLPWRSMAKDSDLCLQVRPFVEHPQSPYSWSHAVAVGSGYDYGNEQSLVDQRSLSRQNTMNQGNMNPFLTFKLNQLEKKDIFLYCSPGNSSKQYFWFSIGTDASVLHTELNAPVYDWKISINSPLKLENRLPCPAEFTIWEKTKEGNGVEKQHGIISSRKSVHIYSADIRKRIYLSLFVQGGWVLEKDPILILDLSSLEHVSSFWMVHQQTNRRLRVSIERDMGGTSAAPKTIRFFVPYWISNDTSLQLAYRVVEVETTDNPDTDSLSRAVKSAKMALKNPINPIDNRNPGTRRNIQVLEVIEDTSPAPVMLSPQDYVSRGGVLPFQSRNDAYLSPRVGIAVAIFHSEHYTPGISLLELENKEWVDVKAFSSDGSYYKLSALLTMTSDRTKVVNFRPHTVFINRVGCSLALQQCGTQPVELIHPNGPPKQFQWQSMAKVELLKLRVEGYKWSTPFSIGSEGVMCVSMKNETGSDYMYVRVEVRSATRSSHYEVVFRPASLTSPYRIENRSMFLPIRFRQVDGTSDSWCSLLPNSASSFLWEDLGRRRLLEVMVDGTDPSKSEKYNIDEFADHQPINVSGGPICALRITVLKEEKMNVVKISDWMPENGLPAVIPRRSSSSLSHMSKNDMQYQQFHSEADSEIHVIVELAEFGLSIIDHTPEEILYLSVQNLLMSHSTGLGSGISRFKLRMHAIQVDNQLPLTPMPVILRPQKVGEQIDYILKLSLTAQSNGSLDLRIYPYIGFHGPENTAFLINIHEPIIWRLHEMIQRANLSRFYDSQTTAVSFDPIIQIGVLNISEIRFKVSMAMSPTQRPRGVLGFWLSLMTALGNTENMPVRINQRFHEDVLMRQSTLISTAISNIQKDLLSQPLQLLSGVDILGNASSALGHMSKGVAALSMDKKFIQSRQRQESKGVEDIGDVIRGGGGALAKGLFRGVTGILTKPLEGAKSSGVEGFVQGVGKGIIGAAAQPVSGVLDLLSKTTEGANAMRMKIAAAITSEEQLLRRRLPRVISGDNLLRPYDEYRAQGQVILQLAESGAFFGQVDLFKVRGKFALSDAYEDHFLLPKGKILVVTHRRFILLQQPSNIMAQRKFSPARDPCSVLWDVLWDDLVTLEMTHGKKDQPSSPPSRLILYLQTRSTELKDHTRVIKCSRETQQALEIYSSIEEAMNTYGPNRSKGIKKNKVPKPYSPSTPGTSELLPKGGPCIWSSPQQVDTLVSLSSTFGSSAT
ncbi:hypothetical protein NE237_013068 [Protea cynaroides]|uniref:C2 domain-containing protein n=1 Tax=Protea cynaroides TaxID=273540 RepID=A0A9Q0JZF8_9MAGN|nr:hypothetical protein NE237_013068 [Protea cynaroides]